MPGSRRFKSFRKKILLVYLTVIVTLLSVQGGLAYYEFQKILAEQATVAHQQLLRQSRENIDLLINNLNYAFVYMSADQYTAEILNRNDLDTVSAYYELLLLKQQFSNFIDLPATDLNTNYWAYLFLNKKEPLTPWLPRYNTKVEGGFPESGVYSPDTVARETWYRQAAKSNGTLNFYTVTDKTGRKQLYIVKSIQNPYVLSSDSLGIALIVVPPAAFARQLQTSQYLEPTRILLMDGSKNVLYSNADEKKDMPEDSEIIRAAEENGIRPSSKIEKIGGRNYYVSCDQLQWGWYMVSAVSSFELLDGMKPMLLLILAVNLIFIVAGSIFTAMAAKRLSRPLLSLSETMRHFDMEKLPDMTGCRFSNDEIGQLCESFESMVRRIQKLIRDIRDGERKQLEAKYTALQAQINPHFLYNTLNTVNWMLIMRKEYDISDTVSALSSIMQYSISRKGNHATVAEELQHVKKFLIIEQLHYGNSISCTFDMPQEALQCVVPKVVLQPLVENAIVHGITCRKGGKGEIRISGRIGGGALRVLVEDNGVGTDTDRLNRSLENGDLIPAKEHGIGIVNVHNRIRMMFGQPYGLRYETNGTGGVTVAMTLPFPG